MNIVVSSVYENIAVVLAVEQLVEFFACDKLTVRCRAKLREDTYRCTVCFLESSSVIKYHDRIVKIHENVLVCRLNNVEHASEYEVRAEDQYTERTSERCRIVSVYHVANARDVESERLYNVEDAV